MARTTTVRVSTTNVADARPQRRGAAPYLLLLPAVAVLILALGYPVVWQLWASFMHYGLAAQFGAAPDFVGLDNYAKALTDPVVWGVISRSLAFCLVNAVLTMAVGVAVALLMAAVNKAVRLIVQIAMLLAWAMPVVAAVTVWSWLFDWRRGIVNYILTGMGLDYTNHVWLGTALGLYFVASIIIVWMSVPFVAFSVYAGLTQVPDEVMEAAQLDGAGPVKRFIEIIVPMVRPVLMIVALLQVIWDLRVFTQLKLLQDQSKPLDSDLFGTYIYAVGAGDFSRSATLSIIVLAITVVFSSAYVRQLLKEDS